jgi:hypothetical protein
MAYTDQQLSDFWWGPGGSPTNIQPGAYVTMKQADVISLTNTMSASYSKSLADLLGYCYANKLFDFGNPRTLWDGTGSNAGIFNGPTKS